MESPTPAPDTSKPPGPPAARDDRPVVRWEEEGAARAALWRSENAAPPPTRVVVADDRMTAATAHRLADKGTALLWRGDFHNARQLQAAMGRRTDRRRGGGAPLPPDLAFRRHRGDQERRARVLGRLLLPLDATYTLPLRRAPDVRAACAEVYGAAADEESVVSLRELSGVISAYEWRRKGVEIPALGARIHPHYGVFSPVRGEYVDLVAQAPLPALDRAFDIGTGSGVLAAVLARRGVASVIGTDRDPRALACARDNFERLGITDRAEAVESDLFPAGRAALVVCNPPWIPAQPTAPIERAVYDPGSRMLRGFIGGLAAHLEPGGEGWLVLSDFAEHLGLRTRAELHELIDTAGLRVIGRADTRPRHRRAADKGDPLHEARAAEVTSLWRLGVR